jgi:uroporphyrinogen-III synthase
MSVLSGKRIVITRASHQAQELADLLSARGAIPVLYPCIAISPPPDTAELDAALWSLADYDWLVLTSSNTVVALAERLRELRIIPNWSPISVATVGSKTAHSAQQLLNVSADFIPQQFTADSLAQTTPVQAGQRVLLPQSTLAHDHLAGQLRQLGAQVTAVNAYQTIRGRGGEDVPALLRNGKIDALTFTSPSTVINFLQRIAPLKPFHLPAVCIGPITENATRKAGFQNALSAGVQSTTDAAEFSIEGIIQTLEHYFIGATADAG